MDASTIKLLVKRGFKLIGSSYRRDFADGTYDVAVMTDNGNGLCILTYTKGPFAILSGRAVFSIDECDDLADYLRINDDAMLVS